MKVSLKISAPQRGDSAHLLIKAVHVGISEKNATAIQHHSL
jgi:hypothetical protein